MIEKMNKLEKLNELLLQKNELLEVIFLKKFSTPEKFSKAQGR